MKKKLAMIHTVNWYERSVMEPFAREFAEQHPEVELINIMEDSLLSESLANGGPTAAVIRRMLLYAMAAESAGADVVIAAKMERHDELVRLEIDRLAARVDAVVLGQISLSKIRHEARVPILQVGRSGFAEARRLLGLAEPEAAAATQSSGRNGAW